jgi:hypothetical protein
VSAALEAKAWQPAVSVPFRGVGLSVKGWTLPSGSRQGLTSSASALMWALSTEFPAVRWALMAHPPSDALVISSGAWRAASANFPGWDRAMGGLSARPRWLVVQGDDAAALEQTAREILTRYQRLVPRTNRHSATSTFREVLSGHRAMHDLAKPLVKADYDHALDVWQWALRLSPMAGLAVQLAALFHDVERLVSEADRRVEHTAADYQAFKNAHAEQGAKMAVEVLDACGVDRGTCAEVAGLIREHELPHELAHGSDLELLADADALSFFSLNSSGFADYYGPDHTRMKVRYSLGRMSPRAIRRLAGVRLREDIASYLDEVARAEARAAIEQVGA